MKTSPKFEVRSPKAEAGCPSGASTAESSGDRGFEPFITKLTVAERMDVEIRTVTRLMRRGVLRFYKVGPMVRFKWSEVESDLREHFRVGFEPKGGRA